MELRRQMYYCRHCREVLVPLDQRLGLGDMDITPGLMRILCRTALELPYQQSQELVTDTLGFEPCSAREIERVSDWHGRRLERASEANLQTAPPPRQRPSGQPRFCLAIDGVMVPGQPDPQQHRLEWHEVKVAVVFDSAGLESPFYVAAWEEAETFGKRLWKALQGWGEQDFRVVLGDGAVWIWNLADEYFPQVSQLLDFYHAAEHLYATAEALWPADTAKNWCEERMLQLKEGQDDHFFASLQWLAARPAKVDEAKRPEKLLHYFQQNRGRLDYPWALRHHLPIGSGMVESSNRSIVQQRLKQAGMRWSQPGAQNVLNLRTPHRSGLFENYWESLAAVNL
jgi:hypothetical protein